MHYEIYNKAEFERQLLGNFPTKSYYVNGSLGDMVISLWALSSKYEKNTESIVKVIIPEQWSDLTYAFPPKKNLSYRILQGKGLVFYHMAMIDYVLKNPENSPLVPLLPTLYPIIPRLIEMGALKYLDWITTILNIKKGDLTKSLGFVAPNPSDAMKLNSINFSWPKNGTPISLFSPDMKTIKEINVSYWRAMIQIFKRKGHYCVLNRPEGSKWQVLEPECDCVIHMPPSAICKILAQCNNLFVGRSGLSLVASLFVDTLRIRSFAPAILDLEKNEEIVPLQHGGYSTKEQLDLKTSYAGLINVESEITFVIEGKENWEWTDAY